MDFQKRGELLINWFITSCIWFPVRRKRENTPAQAADLPRAYRRYNPTTISGKMYPPPPTSAGVCVCVGEGEGRTLRASGRGAPTVTALQGMLACPLGLASHPSMTQY